MMNKPRNPSRVFVNLVVLSVSGLLIASFMTAPAATVAPQGKGGEVLSKPTPTPKKATTRRSTPSRTPTTTKTNPVNKSASEAATAAEIVFWNSIKDSANPDDFRAYLKNYPSGQFADLAKNRLTVLENAAKEAAAKEEEVRQEEAKRKEAEAAKKRPGAVVKNSIGMELVYVPAGTFMMGSDNKGAYEAPMHQVTFREGFYMGRYEVTQRRWQEVMGTTIRQQRDLNYPESANRYLPVNAGEGDNYPMYNVNWNDAQEFVRKLNSRNDGYVYRLPSEAQWEYAARAGVTGPYKGNLDDMAWYQKNSGGRTHEVGTKQANPFGLYDMFGNVQEWCEDWFNDNYDGAPTDGGAWLSHGVQQYSREQMGPNYRVLRGGAWSIDFDNQFFLLAEQNRLITRRNTIAPIVYRWSDIGFRVVAVARAQ